VRHILFLLNKNSNRYQLSLHTDVPIPSKQKASHWDIEWYSRYRTPYKAFRVSATIGPIKGVFDYRVFVHRSVPEHPETNCQLRWRKFNFLCHWKQDMLPASSISVLSSWITTMTVFFKRMLYIAVGAWRSDDSDNSKLPYKGHVVKMVCFCFSCFRVIH
jgi:hypothetical protein